MVIKLNTWTPDTCEDPPCRIVIRFDTDDVPPVAEIAGYEALCAAHDDPVILRDRMQWADGNWKPREAYHDYQRAYFLWLAHQKFVAEAPGQPLPPGLVGHDTEPPTTGSVAAPSPAALAAKATVDAWQNTHQGWKNQARGWVEQLEPGRWAGVNWWFTGAGASRVLHIDTAGTLNNQQRIQLQSFCDVQFGPGAVVVEG
jgi:hypothetical protein